jgi:hypothetical protein
VYGNTHGTHGNGNTAMSSADNLAYNAFFMGDGSTLRPLGAPSGVLIGDRKIQLGSTWRMMSIEWDTDHTEGSNSNRKLDHLVIGHSGGMNPRLFRAHTGLRLTASFNN